MLVSIAERGCGLGVEGLLLQSTYTRYLELQVSTIDVSKGGSQGTDFAFFFAGVIGSVLSRVPIPYRDSQIVDAYFTFSFFSVVKGNLVPVMAFRPLFLFPTNP